MLFPCERCGLLIRVLGEDDEIEILLGPSSDFWPDKYECPACRNPVSPAEEAGLSPDVLVRSKVRDLTAQECFRAMSGLGMPDELQCSARAVTQLFAKKIKKVVGKEIPSSGRFLVEHIEFEDGSRAFFGASSFGALIYRITEPHSYVEQVSNA